MTKYKMGHDMREGKRRGKERRTEERRGAERRGEETCYHLLDYTGLKRKRKRNRAVPGPWTYMSVLRFRNRYRKSRIMRWNLTPNKVQGPDLTMTTSASFPLLPSLYPPSHYTSPSSYER
jgi:hypothetical protein